MSNVTTTFPPYAPAYVESPKALSLVLYLDFKTASTIATTIVHSKLDYCNSLLQPSEILNKSSSGYQNSLARAAVKAPKFRQATPILKSLHWLKINERI